MDRKLLEIIRAIDFPQSVTAISKHRIAYDKDSGLLRIEIEVEVRNYTFLTYRPQPISPDDYRRLPMEVILGKDLAYWELVKSGLIQSEIEPWQIDGNIEFIYRIIDACREMDRKRLEEDQDDIIELLKIAGIDLEDWYSRKDAV